MLKIWSMVSQPPNVIESLICVLEAYIKLTINYRNRSRPPPRTLKAGKRRRKSQRPNYESRRVWLPSSFEHQEPPKDPYADSQPTLSDLSELSLGGTMRTHFPNPDDILNFTLTIEPDEGMYKGGAFHFNFAINQNFPHDPPKVKCIQKIYHPNIDLEGNVCLNILREDWKPVLNLNAVIVGLQVRLWPIRLVMIVRVLRTSPRYELPKQKLMLTR